MKRISVFLLFALLVLAFFLVSFNKPKEYDNVNEGNFLIVEDDYSPLKIKVDSNAELPDQYVIEWIVSDGFIWSEFQEKNQKGNPFTFSSDTANGAVNWRPDDYTSPNDVTLRAYIYEDENSTQPIAYSKITLEYYNETYRLKELTR